jgi:chromosome segregation ATPase
VERNEKNLSEKFNQAQEIIEDIARENLMNENEKEDFKEISPTSNTSADTKEELKKIMNIAELNKKNQPCEIEEKIIKDAIVATEKIKKKYDGKKCTISKLEKQIEDMNKRLEDLGKKVEECKNDKLILKNQVESLPEEIKKISKDLDDNKKYKKN